MNHLRKREGKEREESDRAGAISDQSQLLLPKVKDELLGEFEDGFEHELEDGVEESSVDDELRKAELKAFGEHDEASSQESVTPEADLQSAEVHETVDQHDEARSKESSAPDGETQKAELETLEQRDEAGSQESVSIEDEQQLEAGLPFKSKVRI